MISAPSINKQPNAVHIRKSGIINLSHLLYGIFDTARYPISDDDIGSTELEKPSPSWNARTAVWREIPTRSDTGTYKHADCFN